jgi:hypothetical protein
MSDLHSYPDDYAVRHADDLIVVDKPIDSKLEVTAIVEEF